MMGRRIFILAALLIAALGICRNACAWENAMDAPGTAIVAHRGGAGYRPENTLEAFRYAPSTRPVAIETDVRSTLDGVQVMCHDDAIVVDGREYKLRKKEYAELKALQPDLCTLDDALAVIADTNLALFLELKSGSNVPRCIDAVKRYGLYDRTTFISFRASKLQQARDYDPDAALGLIFGKTPNDLGESISRLGLAMLCQRDVNLTRDNLSRWQALGLHVNVWTVDKETRMAKYMKWGVDSITTNYPLLAASIAESDDYSPQ